MADDAVALFYMSANNYILHLLLYYSLTRKTPIKRRWWMTTMYRRRTRESMEILLTEIQAEPSGQFFNFFRMSATDFEFLLNKIAPSLTKQDTKFRKAIPPKIRLAITLRYLASGDSFKSLQYLFKISNQLISKIVEEVCIELIVSLKDEVKLPANERQWLEVEDKFKDIFPHCIGAMDGKHVVIVSPDHSGTDFFNYKNTFSIVLFALVDRNYCFLFADIGCQGRISDGGVLKNSILCKKMVNNDLNLPAPCPLPGRTKDMPYVFLGDNAFPLQNNIMKPFPGDYREGSIERLFNKNLSSAPIVVENVFGIMSAKFRVLRKPINLQPEKATNVVMACVLLHNFLRKSKTSTNSYTPYGYVDTFVNGQMIPGSWRQEQNNGGALRSLPSVARRPSLTPIQIRREFAEYISTNVNGRIPTDVNI